MATTTATAAAKTPQKKMFEYEFGGPVGALATTLLLPIVVLWLAHCSHVGYIDLSCFREFFLLWKQTSFWNAVVQSPVFCPSCSGSGDSPIQRLAQCTAAVLAWFLFQVALERCLPCQLVPGAPIQQHPDHPRLLYRINGHLAFWVTLLIALAGWPVWEEERSGGTLQLTSFPYWSLLYDYFAELALVTTALCFVVNTYLYLNSFRALDNNSNSQRPPILAAGGDSGNCFYDFFMGRELNPRLLGGSFDWKEFCELRPGLIGWVLLNAASAHQQYVHQGGYLSGSMILIQLFHGVYVWDALYQEPAILTTMDITTDGFGFMLLFGDLVWVPFTYSLQARYLVYHDPHLSWPALAAIVAVHGLGYAIFRGANGQKNAFRTDPTDPAVAHLTYLQTQRGTKLLTSGWWGLARKINYTGDYIMGLSWCLVCGWNSLVPYFYAVYFMILLVHRSIRDDHMCRQKYGDDWETYKKLVPYRFIPGVV